jgi:hypothetical protein
LADVLVNGYGWGNFSMSLATFGDLSFPFLIVGRKENAGCWDQYQRSGACIAAATFEQTTRGH